MRVTFSVLRSVLSTGVMMSHGPNAERDHSEREWSTTESSGAEPLIQVHSVEIDKSNDPKVVHSISRVSPCNNSASYYSVIQRLLCFEEGLERHDTH